MPALVSLGKGDDWGVVEVGGAAEDSQNEGVTGIVPRIVRRAILGRSWPPCPTRSGACSHADSATRPSRMAPRPHRSFSTRSRSNSRPIANPVATP